MTDRTQIIDGVQFVFHSDNTYETRDIPVWSKPSATFVKATAAEQLENYRRIALAELDELYPTE